MTARIRRPMRLTLLRLAFAGTLGLLPLMLGTGARAATAPALGGWNVNADGNVIDMVLDNATGLAGIHPFTEADFPEAESQFATGPFGSGLATVFWPGSAGGNFGSLSEELGIPSQLEPLVSQLNDPVRANAQYPSGPASASYPAGASGGAIEMQSTAGANGTTATAALSDESVPSLISFSSAKGTSSSSAAGSAAGGTATSDLGGISLLGGLVDIGSVTSTATATSTGTTSSGSTVTHVAGVTVLGQPASIGTDGLVLPKIATSSNLLDSLIPSILQTALQQTVSALGLRVTEFPSSQVHSGASDTVTSGGVQVEVIPPAGAATTLEAAAALLAPYFPSQAAIVPTLPGLLQGATLTITIGRSTASAAASPPFNSSFTPPPLPTTPATTIAVPSTTPASPSSVIPPSSSGGQTIPGSTTPVVVTPGVSTPGSVVAPSSTPASTPFVATPISLSTPLGAGLVVLGLLATAALGYGLWLVARMLLPEDAAPICPLGQENP